VGGVRIKDDEAKVLLDLIVNTSRAAEALLPKAKPQEVSDAITKLVWNDVGKEARALGAIDPQSPKDNQAIAAFEAARERVNKKFEHEKPKTIADYVKTLEDDYHEELDTAKKKQSKLRNDAKVVGTTLATSGLQMSHVDSHESQSVPKVFKPQQTQI
jgi:hypothetical protein